jgi:antitoxin component YwqK of YwqJK toxin-antitoxin module
MTFSLHSKSLTISALAALFICVHISAKAQENTTLYYDQNGKGLDSKKKAVFYRTVKFDVGNKPVGTVEDFYMNGKPFTKGEAIYIDKQDDSKSRWTGTVITFNEKGRQIKQDGYDTNGLLDGKQFIFDNEGTKISERTYLHGNPTENYYTIYTKDGVQAKYSYLNKMPVNLATTDKKLAHFSDKGVLYQNGEPLQYYTTPKGLSVAAKFTLTQLWGDYFEIYITIENGSNEQFNFDPSEITAVFQNDNKMIPVDVLSFDTYTSRVSHKQKWSPGFSAFANTALLNPAGYSAITTKPIAAQSDTSGYKPYIMKQNISEGYLKLNTMLPGTRLVGFVNVKYHRVDHFLLNVPVNGYVYQFEL